MNGVAVYVPSLYVRLDYPTEEAVTAVGVPAIEWYKVLDGNLDDPRWAFREARPDEIANAARARTPEPTETQLEQLLLDCWMQFAFKEREGQPAVRYAGGLSALEEARDFLVRRGRIGANGLPPAAANEKAGAA